MPVSRVVLSGGGSRLAPLAEQLADPRHRPVEAGQALQALQIGRVGLDSESLADLEPVAAVPVGLALGEVA